MPELIDLLKHNTIEELEKNITHLKDYLYENVKTALASTNEVAGAKTIKKIAEDPLVQFVIGHTGNYNMLQEAIISVYLSNSEAIGSETDHAMWLVSANLEEGVWEILKGNADLVIPKYNSTFYVFGEKILKEILSGEELDKLLNSLAGDLLVVEDPN